MPPPTVTGHPSSQTLNGKYEKFAAGCALIRRFAITVIAAFAVVSVVSASYTGLNGNHVWRQSDSYSQILGMLSQPGLGRLDTFEGHRVMFDVPVYQMIIAALSTITNGEPLVIVRIFGAILLVIFLIAATNVAEAISAGAGLILAALLATSPLYLHYFATPLPDVFTLTCSAVAIMLLITRDDWLSYWLALCLLVISALIKAPIPFVLLVFYVTWLLVNWHSVRSRQSVRIKLGGLLLTSQVAAIVAELIRFYTNPKVSFRWLWYFGAPTERISSVTWKTAGSYATEVFAFKILAFAATIALALYLVRRRFEGFKVLLPLGMGFAAGWLVFTRLYVMHDYYGLPTTLLLLMAVSIAIREIAGPFRQRVDLLSKAAPAMVILVVFLMIVYGHKMSSYGVTSEGQAMRFILRDAKHFVYVSNEDPNAWDPIVGGVTAKPFSLISSGKFERSCVEILHHEQAVVIDRWNVEGPLKCLAVMRESAVSFMEGPQYQILSW